MKRNRLFALSLCLVVPIFMSGDGKKKPPSLAGTPPPASSSQKSDKPPAKGATPGPSLAKKHELPPGLEKKFGKKRPSVAWIAFDPARTDRAWLLIDGKWKLEENFDKDLRGEVKASLAIPTAKPPVPLPKVGAKLKVVKFE
jgi:hypothetical protein